MQVITDKKKEELEVQGLCPVAVETSPRSAGGAGRSNRRGGQEEETDSLAGAQMGERETGTDNSSQTGMENMENGRFQAIITLKSSSLAS